MVFHCMKKRYPLKHNKCEYPASKVRKKLQPDYFFYSYMVFLQNIFNQSYYKNILIFFLIISIKETVFLYF